MPQRGVRFTPIRKLFQYFASLYAQQEAERRADALLNELLALCKGSKVNSLRIVRKYGDYIYANGVSIAHHGSIRSHRIDDADYQAALVFFELHKNPKTRTTKLFSIDDTCVAITPELTQSQAMETLTLNLDFSSSSHTASPN